MSRKSNYTSGVCITTKGDKCWPGGLVNAVHILNAALFIAVKGRHRFVVPPTYCERADLLFRADKRDWQDLQRSVPWYEARCNTRRFVPTSSLCGANWRVPPDMHTPDSALRLLPMPMDEFAAHPTVPSCNDHGFVLRGESDSHCRNVNFGLADMQLKNLNAQMVCGPCRAKSNVSPCRTVVELPASKLIPHPDYRETRLVLRSKFHAALNARGLSPEAEKILKEIGSTMVVALHLPLREPGSYMADGDQGHDRFLALSWWIFGLEQIVTHVYAWCVRVHVFTDALPHHPDLAALKKRFPALTFTIHGDEVPESDALVAMASAHVLLAGSSSFSRLAAVLSRGVVLAPGGLPLRPLTGLRAVITAYDGRFWDRSPNADLEFWEGRSDLVGTASRLIQLYLAQRHQGNSTATAKCMRVTTVTNCKLRMVHGQSTVVCS